MNPRTKLASALLVFALVFSLTALSQEAHPSKSEGDQAVQDLITHSSAQASAESYKQSPERYFRLDFRVLDVSPEGKIVNSHSYHEIIVSGPKSYRFFSIRTGDRVPVATGVFKDSAINTQFQTIDAGTDIDVNHVEIINRTLRLNVRVSITTFSSTGSSPYMPADMKEPITRHISWDSCVTVPINQPTIVFSADDNADKGKSKLELTAVPINQ